MDTFCSRRTCNDCTGHVVCRCLNVTEDALVEALTTGEIRTLRDLRRQTGAGDGCTACHHRLVALIERHAFSLAVVE